jgi:hypothetical protein
VFHHAASSIRRFFAARFHRDLSVSAPTEVLAGTGHDLPVFLTDHEYR